MFWFALRSGYASDSTNNRPSVPPRVNSAAASCFIAAGSPGFAAAACKPPTAALRDDRFERLASLHVAFDRLDQIRNQVVPALELHFDLSEGVLQPVPEHHQLVVDPHAEHQQQQHDAADDDRAMDQAPNRPAAATQQTWRRSFTRCGRWKPRITLISQMGEWRRPKRPVRANRKIRGQQFNNTSFAQLFASLARSIYSPVRVSIRQEIADIDERRGQNLRSRLHFARLRYVRGRISLAPGSQYSTLSTTWFGGVTAIAVLL